ncbi:hypothetical protein [Methylobacterium sp. Leaf88]|uniref:hypothetical protein n=1 Tax=Methylobacterium sp. Leaf88 TaxID=1736244 RepID=UPI0012E82B12|nr:hypothetical protein [Methylobacterium sp. Leaf88]
MSEAIIRFRVHLAESEQCLENFRSTSHEFSLRHIWIISVSSFDLYLTELVSEAGLRLIDKTPRILTQNLRQVEFPLGNVLEIDRMNSVERLLFFKQHIFASIQYKSFYRPEKISEALSYIWTCPAKEKWARILGRMKLTGRYSDKTEEDIREELTLIGDRRDLIAHSVDRPPGRSEANPVRQEDAARVHMFIADIAEAIDLETEALLS